MPKLKPAANDVVRANRLKKAPQTPHSRLAIKTGATKQEHGIAKQQYEIHKDSTYNKLKVNKVQDVIKHMVEADNDFDDEDRKRVVEMCKLIADTKDMVNFDQIWLLCQGKVDVLMLNRLFHDHNSGKSSGTPFVDFANCMAILDQLHFPIPAEELKLGFDVADHDGTGYIYFEAFVTLCQGLFGNVLQRTGALGAKSHFQALNDKITNMNSLLHFTAKLIAKYEQEVEDKMNEIGNILGDKTHEDMMNRLKQALDVKDQLEQSLMGMKVKQCSQMKDYLMKLDTEKTDIADKYSEEVRNRNMDRDKVARIRRTFEHQLKHQFLSFPVLIQQLGFIKEATVEFNTEIDAAMLGATDTLKKQREVAKFEKPPKPSTTADAVSFLKAQRGIVDQIKIKMKQMQEERDVYENQIADEVQKNQVVRLEVINLNMEITNLEGEQMVQERLLKDQRIQSMTLKAAVEEAAGDTDSKKVKALMNTAFQFSTEEEEVWTEIKETKEKLIETKRRITVSKQRVSRLNIELGELKILLEEIIGVSNTVGKGAAMIDMMETLGEGQGDDIKFGKDDKKHGYEKKIYKK